MTFGLAETVVSTVCLHESLQLPQTAESTKKGFRLGDRTLPDSDPALVPQPLE